MEDNRPSRIKAHSPRDSMLATDFTLDATPTDVSLMEESRAETGGDAAGWGKGKRAGRRTKSGSNPRGVRGVWHSKLTGLTVAATVMLLAAVAAGLIVPSFGAFSGSFTQSQNLSAGVVTLGTVTSGNSTVTTNLTNVAPNDQYTRYVTITNSGTVDLGSVDITAAVTAGADTVNPSATNANWANGVRIQVERCTGTWTWNASSPSSSCSNNTWSTTWGNGTLGVLNVGAGTTGTTMNASVTTGALAGLASGQSAGLRVTLYVCAGSSVTPAPPTWTTAANACNGASVDAAIMGSTATYTLSFKGTSRAGTTTG